MAAEPSTHSGNGLRPPTEASPGRRLFHTLIAVAGWCLFVYWWWLVFHRVSPREVRFTVLFIVFSLAIIVMVTAAWAFHNLSIYARRGPRRRIREVRPDFSHDRVGRDVTFQDAADFYRAAPVVYVRVTEQGKTYEARGTARAPGDAFPPVAPEPSPQTLPGPQRQPSGEGPA